MAHNHLISIEEASELTRNFRITNPNAQFCEFFNREAIEALLMNEDIIGIRIYYGSDCDNNNNLKMVLVGVLPGEEESPYDEDDLSMIMERGLPCPTTCSSANALNSLTIGDGED